MINNFVIILIQYGKDKSLKICPNCKAENIAENVKFCHNCGLPIDNVEDPGKIDENPAMTQNDEELDFVITEADGSKAPEMFGGTGKASDKKANAEDDLEIKDNAYLLEDEAAREKTGRQEDDTKAGMSFADFSDIANDPIPNETNGPRHSDTNDKKEISNQDDYDSKASGKHTPDQPNEDKIKTGTQSKPEEPVSHTPEKSLEQNRPSAPVQESGPKVGWDSKERKPFPDPSQKSQPFNAIRQITDPAKMAPEVTKSARARGKAFYWNNYIQIAGKPFLHEKDEITIKDKNYILEKKQFGGKIKMAAIGIPFLLVLIIVGSLFIQPTVGGNGLIVGVVLDEYGQPYVEGALVTIDELGKSTRTNPQGFFRFDMIPTGTYRFIYELGDEYIGEANATIMAGQATLMMFGDLQRKVISSTERPVKATKVAAKPPKTEPSKQTTKPTKPQKTTSQKSYGKIKLAANVDGAKLVLDRKTIGAGNTIYSRIPSGDHKITVSKPGYTEYTGVVNIKKNQTKTLTVNLSRKPSAGDQSLTANDCINLGDDAVSNGQHQTAIADYTSALALSPSNIEAYEKRARVYSQTGNDFDAVSDYLRAGEICRFKNNPDKAISYFNKALKLSPENNLALVGRAGARIDKSEYRAAMIDYDDALENDNDFYPALFGAGLCHYKLGKNKDAEKYFKKAKKANPDDPYLYHYMMLNYLAKDDVKMIRKTYSEFKTVADPTELAKFKSTSEYEPIIRLLKSEEL
jgi:Tfp pilus assembly protein PilF